MKNISLLLFLFLFFLPLGAKEEVSADHIAQRAMEAVYYAGRTSRARIVLTLSDAQGAQRKREIILSRKNVGEEGQQHFFVYFKSPNDVRQMALLVHKKPDAVDDRWLYLPALDLVRRIAAQDKRTSFAGSDFLYEDVSGRHWKRDRWTLKSRDETTWTLSGVPRDTDEVEYARVEMIINQATRLPQKAVYFNGQDKPRREITVDQIRVVDDIPVIVKMTARDLEADTTSVMEIQDITFNVEIPDVTFTERSLRNPPRDARR